MNTSKIILNWDEYNFAAWTPWVWTNKYIDKYYLNWTEYKIKFENWWQPWANTIAYYPLDSTNTVNDLSWNNHTLTASWTYSFDSLAVHFSTIWDNYLICSDVAVITIANNMTWQCWVKADDNSSKPCFWVMSAVTDCWWNATWNEASGAYRMECLAWSYSADSDVWDWTTWHLYTVVLANWVFTLYIDCVPTATANNWWTYAQTLYLKINKIWWMTNRWKAQYSKFIIEDKGWTTDEMTAYYNQTKSLYGIS